MRRKTTNNGPQRLRPAEGGKMWQETVGERLEEPFLPDSPACRGCGYHVCACEPSCKVTGVSYVADGVCDQVRIPDGLDVMNIRETAERILHGMGFNARVFICGFSRSFGVSMCAGGVWRYGSVTQREVRRAYLERGRMGDVVSLFVKAARRMTRSANGDG